MRTSIAAALTAATACGILVGGETTAFAWVLDLIAMDRLSLSHEAVVAGGLVGIGIGIAVSLWVTMKVYRAELAMGTSTTPKV